MAAFMVNQQSKAGRLVCVLGLLALFVWWMPADSSAAGVGRLAYVRGDVTVQRGSSIETAERGSVVYRSDIIVTGADGRAKLVMADGSRVYVGSRSRIEVAEYVKRDGLLSGAFNMFWGKARFFVRKLLSQNSSFRVRTSTAVLGVRGTSFFVNQPMPEGLQPSAVQTMSFDDFAREYQLPVRVVLQTGRLDISLISGKVVSLEAGRTADITPRGEVSIHPTAKGDESAPPPVEGGAEGKEPEKKAEKKGGKAAPKAEKKGGKAAPKAGKKGGKAAPKAGKPKAKPVKQPVAPGQPEGAAPSSGQQKALPAPPSPQKVITPAAAAGGGAAARQGTPQVITPAGTANPTTSSAIQSAVGNAKQNLGTTTQVTIQPRFVLP